jgi:hypothetical protein
MLFRLSLFITSSSLRMIPVRTPCGNYSNTPKYLNLLNMCNSATVVFNHSSLVYKSEVSASLRTPCMSPVLDLHFYQNENNGIPPKLFRDELWTLVNAHLVDVFTALIAGTLAQEEKQLKLIPLLSLSLRFQTLNMKSYIHILTTMHDRKSKTTISISFTYTHRKHYNTMNLNSKLHILISELLYIGSSLHNSLLSSCLH